jgi:uncharacterized HhH-GPD family protein
MTSILGRTQRQQTRSCLRHCSGGKDRGGATSLPRHAGAVPIRFTEPPGPEDLVNHDALALLIAMLLDQQIPIEWAFAGPARLAERMGGTLDAVAIASMDPDELIALAAAKPAIHRYPAAMARRIHELCRHLVDRYDGDARRIWHRARSGQVVFERLMALPGFGPEKSQITLAVLAKRMGRTVSGWEALAGPFSDDQPRSVADVGSASDLARLRERRRELKISGKTKTD